MLSVANDATTATGFYGQTENTQQKRAGQGELPCPNLLMLFLFHLNKKGYP